MRSFTTQLVFEHKNGYAVIKKLNLDEMTQNRFKGAKPEADDSRSSEDENQANE